MMNSKLFKILAIGAMALAFTACDEDNDSDVSAEVGKTCDEATYGYQCDGRFILACDKGTIIAFEDCGKNYECVGNGEEAGCIMPCSGNSEKFICESDEEYGISVSARYVCKEDTYYAVDETSLVFCYNGCNKDNTACKKVHNEEGKSCDESTYKRKCDGRIAVTCSEGVVTALDCGEDNVCVENENGRLSCKTPCTGNEEKSVCTHNAILEYSYTKKYVCKDGYYVDDITSLAACNNGCNEAGTACAE